MSYNVQTLFDQRDDGWEYAEYLSSRGLWNEKRCHQKLSNIQSVIKAVSEGGPDILLLQEVESGLILKQLREDYLWDLGYRGCYIPSSEGVSSLKVAVLSRFPAERLICHNHQGYGSQISGSRETLELEFLIHGRPLVVFNVHWKSRLGDEQPNQASRLASATLIKRRIRQLTSLRPALEIIVAGDFNLDAADLQASGILTGKAIKGSTDRGALYLPPFRRGEPGSFSYRGVWEQPDHCLMSGSLFDGTGWSCHDYQVFKPAFILDQKGIPLGFNLRNGEGFSDHLPLLLYLDLEEASAGPVSGHSVHKR